MQSTANPAGGGGRRGHLDDSRSRGSMWAGRFECVVFEYERRRPRCGRGVCVLDCQFERGLGPVADSITITTERWYEDEERGRRRGHEYYADKTCTILCCLEGQRDE